MAPLEFILNLAALLLWLSWRSLHLDPLAQTTPAALVGTLKRAEPRFWKGWHLAAGLALLLVLRAVLYWAIASPAEWTPKLDLGVVVLVFRSDRFWTELAFSLLSFLRLLMVFYFWLLTVAAINHRVVDPDPIQRLLRLQLGRLARWPWPVQLLLPLLAANALWLALHPLLVLLGIADPAHTFAHLLEQGLLVGLGLFFTLKYVLPVFLFLHLFVSYVYLGNSPLWTFVSGTARNLLAPLQWLRFAKLDLAPVVGVALVFFFLHVLPNSVLKYLAQRNFSLWPQ